MKFILTLNLLVFNIFSAQIFPCRIADKWAFSDSNGNLINSIRYDSILLSQKFQNSNHKRFVVETFNKRKVINDIGDEIFDIPQNVNDFYFEHENPDVLYLIINEKYKIVFKGRLVSEALFDNVYQNRVRYLKGIEGDLTKSVNDFIVSKNYKYGVIDLKGNYILQIIYDRVQLENVNGKVKWIGSNIAKDAQEGLKY